VNKTESAIRLLHVPSGITVSMQDERSQHQNRRKAFQVLRARLMDRKLLAEQAASRAVRRSIIKGADRSEKVRTYNFAQVRARGRSVSSVWWLNRVDVQDRVTDHRIGLTIKNVQAVLEGEALQDFLDALGKHQDQETLEEMLAELQGEAAAA
jgi:peptide chain release factor 1